MTVSVESMHVFHQGDGSQTLFPFNFKAFDPVHLYVYVMNSDGTYRELSLSYDYTVTGANGSQDGGYITLTSVVPSASQKVLITRVLPLQQLLDLRNQGAYFPEDLENTYDRIVMMLQQHDWDVDRALKKDFEGLAWNALHLRIINLADPTDDADAATLGTVREFSANDRAYIDQKLAEIEASTGRAADYADQAETSAATAVAARNQSVAAAEASGPTEFEDTYADAVAAAYPEDTVVRVFADESRDGGVSDYRVVDGQLVWKWSPADKYVTANGVTKTQQQWAAEPNESEVTATISGNKKSLAGWASDISSSIKTVTTVSDLREFDASELFDGMLFNVRSFSSDSDKGGGLFYWDASSEEAADGYITIQLDGVTTGRFKSHPERILTPEAFGAIANIDVDQSTALQRFFDVGGVIDAGPQGYYYVTKAGLESLEEFGILPGNDTEIRFKNNTEIVLEDGVDVRHIVIAAPNRAQRCKIYDMAIRGYRDVVSYSNGWGAANSRSVTLIRPRFYNIKGRSYIETYLSGDTAYGGGRALTFQFNNWDAQVIAPYFENCDFPLDIVGDESSENEYGKSNNRNCTVIGAHMENCACLVEAYGRTRTGAVTDTSDLDYTGLVISGVTFHNCGKSSAYRVNSSWTRQNTDGNSLPFASPARAGTTYANQDWLLSEYDETDEEWTSAATYAVGSKVKYTDMGTNSALIALEGTSGISVIGVRGYNDSDYGAIGAVYRGTAKAVRVVDVDVNVNCYDIARFGPVPHLGFIARAHEAAEAIEIDVTNNGITKRIAHIDTPTTGTSMRSVLGCQIRAKVRRDGNLALVSSDFATGALPRCTYITIQCFDGRGGIISGTPDTLIQYANMEAVGKTSSTATGFVAKTNPEQITIPADAPQLRLERTGTGAGFVELYANGNGLQTTKSIMPRTAGGAACGTLDYPWANVWSQNSVSVTSDKNQKNSIEDIPDELIEAWGSVRKRRYKLNAEGENAKWCIGVIAQEVWETIESAGINPSEYKLVQREVTTEGEETWFVSPGDIAFLDAEWIKRKLS